MFDNCDPNTNGELAFYHTHIRNNTNIIFDVGSRDDTLFNDFSGEVHYFEPDMDSLSRLKEIPKVNRIAKYNNFGLGINNETCTYYSEFQSFINRDKSLPDRDCGALKNFTIKKGYDYIIQNNVYSIDFLKIDTEGFELNVIKGFGDLIKIVKTIQFEYGGCFLDAGVTLNSIITYLEEMGFTNFCYLSNSALIPITDRTDHYLYCNIICSNISPTAYIPPAISTNVKKFFIMNSPELPTPGTHYYTTSKLSSAFNYHGYEVLEAKVLDDIIDGSIVIISNHGIYHSDKDNRWALDYLAKKFPNCVYICWFYHRMYDQIPFKKFILTGEHFRKKPSLEFHIECWNLQGRINNYIPFTFSSPLLPHHIGILPRNERLNGCFIGTAYKYEWVRELPNMAYVSTPGNNFSEEDRIKLFLSSKIGFGFHSDANIVNNCIVERVFEAMAFGCVVISDNPVAAEITNNIVQIATSKEQFLEIYHDLLSDNTRLKDLQARGLEWVKNNGLYIHVAKKFLDKINEFEQVGWTPKQ